MPTSRRPPLLPVPRTGGHEKTVPGAAGDRQCGIRKIPDPGRGFRLHREEPQDGEDTAQGAWGTEMYSMLGACKVLGKDAEKWLAYTLKHIGSTKPENLYRLLPEEWTE